MCDYKMIGLILMVTALLPLPQGVSQQIPERNGFVLSDLKIPLGEIRYGGPPGDGIPSIDQPKFLEASDAFYLKSNDLVIGVSVNDESKAYPIRILNWHEIVNDEVGGLSVVITYCPLCRSGVVFDACIDGELYTFGVSGLLYNSDVLLYDRETKSLWSQLMGSSISGDRSGTPLETVTSQMVTWEEWQRWHPDTKVLSTDTGFARNYNSTPYTLYSMSEDLMFPVDRSNRILPNKELVVGVELDGQYIAFPFSRLGRGKKEKTFRSLKVEFDRARKTAVVYDSHGDVYPSVTLYWFAWYAFHPETRIYPVK